MKTIDFFDLMRYHNKVVKNKGGMLIMEEDNMKNAVQDENRKGEFNKEENDRHDSISKIEIAPVWNEDLQKIVVGYH